MKYLTAILLFLLAIYFYTIGIFHANGWQFWQPFLVIVLLFYFNNQDVWLNYILAMVAGFYLDSLTGVFGLYAILYVFIIFILRWLQLTRLSSRNILTILLLAFLANFIFWSGFWLLNLIFSWSRYIFSWELLWQIGKGVLVNIFIVIFFHVLYYNFWVKHHARQPF